ncbi:MAG: SDR family NAD(P)-dependent oxidoreductase, partial [Vicinamibacteria bacterium]
PGAALWPCEVIVAAADDAAGLGDEIARLRAAADCLEAWPVDGAAPPAISLGAIAMAAASRAARGGAHRMAVVASSAADLRARLDEALAALDGGAAGAAHVGQGEAEGGLAFLFPGQGSQAPDMGREVATYFACLRDAVEQADAIRPVSGAMWPPAAFTDAARERQRRALADTAVAQPAIGAISVGLLDVLGRAGVRASAVAGHSYGEFVALHAAGALDRASLLRLSAARGRAMASVGDDAGTMAIVALPVAALSPYLDRASGVVVVANINAPAQTVISGATGAVADVVARVRADGHTAAPLPVSGAFHSPLMTPARDGLRGAIEATAFQAPLLPVHANLDGQPYPAEPAAIRARLVEHLEQRVDFVAQVHGLYDAGIRTFVEVGPGRVLSGLVRRTLESRPHRVVSTDGGLRGLLDAVAALFAAGHATDLQPLFEGRALPWVDLDRLPALPAPPAWQIDGAHVWRAGAAARTSGIEPFLTVDTAALAPRATTSPGPLDDLRLPAGADGAVLDVYREYERTMRHFLDQQERMLARVLGGAVDRGPDVSGAPPPAPSSPQAEAAREPSAGPLDVSPTGLAARLVRIVGDRTGYSDDAVGLDQDLEADLGIDSIKRIEIIGTFATSLPAAHARRLQTELDRLTRLRTLKAIAHASAQALERVDAAPVHESGAADEVPRFVVRRVPAPAAVARRSLAGLHVVSRDAGGVAEAVARALRTAGAAVAVLGDEAFDDEASLASALDEARRGHGPVRGVVHLSALGRPAMPDRAAAWRAEAGATTRRLFTLLKQVTPDLAAAPGGTVLAVTALGGDWGRTPFAAGAEIAAGCHGLLRAWAREYPSLAGLVLDLDPAAPVEAQASRIVAEYHAADLAEAGHAGETRTSVAVAPAPLDDRPEAPAMQPQAGWVILATGGARGITAEVCQELAGPGMRFVLVGRGGGGADADAERRATMEALAALGATAEFVRADVADDAAFGAAIDEVYARHGRIDAVLHGAGVIADQRFELKPVASLDHVFATKVGSAETLARHLRPDGL